MQHLPFAKRFSYKLKCFCFDLIHPHNILPIAFDLSVCSFTDCREAAIVFVSFLLESSGFLLTTLPYIPLLSPILPCYSSMQERPLGSLSVSWGLFETSWNISHLALAMMLGQQLLGRVTIVASI